MTLRAWIIELRGPVHEALAPDLAQLREELAQQRTRMNLMRIQLADQNLRISHLTRKGDTRRAEVERLRDERDHSRACFERASALIHGIHALLYPPHITLPDGRTMAFRPSSLDPHEVLQELSNRIRALPDELDAPKGPK